MGTWVPPRFGGTTHAYKRNHTHLGGGLLPHVTASRVAEFGDVRNARQRGFT